MSYSSSSLLKPFTHKSLNLRNRLVMAPMTRAQSPNGIPTAEVVDYYARRALGEVGLILSEGTVINRPGSTNHPDVPQFYGEALPAWKKVIDAVHANHGQMSPQLWHVGVVPPRDPAPKLAAPLEGPSNMTTADVEATIAAFAEAARQTKRLGFDSIELHGAHGYLIDQFFWDKTNLRTDRFGGKTLKERSRFAVEVLQAVRAAVGPDFAVILRLSQWKQQDYTSKMAQTPAEMEQWLLPLVEAGADILHLSQRRFWEAEFQGSDLSFAGWAKKITGHPTITVGSVGLTGDMMGTFQGESSAPQALDELLRRFDRGDFDLVAVGRAILQDPEWVLKIKNQRQSELKAFSAASLGTYY